MVKLILSNGRQIYSTFSLKPALPSGISKRGLRRDQYLEIDPKFAMSLNIREGEEVRGITRERELYAQPLPFRLWLSRSMELILLVKSQLL